MKRLLTLMLIGVLAILVMVPISWSRELTGGTTTWKFICDTTKLQAHVDTINYYLILDSASSGNRLFLTDLTQWRSNIGGYFSIRYSSMDTSAAGTYPDSTKDTVQLDFITGDVDGVPQKVVWTSGKLTGFSKWTESDSTSDYNWINISPDSTLGNYLWARIRCQVADSVGVKLAANSYAGIHFKLNIKLFADE